MDIAETLAEVSRQLATLGADLKTVKALLENQRSEKEWYTTTELAAALRISNYTVQERYCNGGRIECEKDPYSGKWRIPGHEFRRLINGGSLKPRANAE